MLSVYFLNSLSIPNLTNMAINKDKRVLFPRDKCSLVEESAKAPDGIYDLVCLTIKLMGMQVLAKVPSINPLHYTVHFIPTECIIQIQIFSLEITLLQPRHKILIHNH